MEDGKQYLDVTVLSKGSNDKDCELTLGGFENLAHKLYGVLLSKDGLSLAQDMDSIFDLQAKKEYYKKTMGYTWNNDAERVAVEECQKGAYADVVDAELKYSDRVLKVQPNLVVRVKYKKCTAKEWLTVHKDTVVTAGTVLGLLCASTFVVIFGHSLV